jgi:UDP-glucose 4-epimerase
VYGDGQQTRCFSAVGDVVRGVQMLADNDMAIGRSVQHRVRGGSHGARAGAAHPQAQPQQVADLVRALRAGVRRSFEDMRRRVPDLAKIQRVTGYRPEISLDQLLQLTISHMKVPQEAPPSRPARFATA